MSILIDEKTKVIVQGITGREGSLRSKYMKDYGTKVVAGTSPGRGGQEVNGIPVYNTVKEAIRAQGSIDMSVTFIPGTVVKMAILEALDAGIKYIVSPAERVPLHDIMEVVLVAKKEGATIIGPGSLGLLSPGKAVAGWLGGNVEWANMLFQSGPIGVLSRSGGESGTLPWILKNGGLGVSTAIHTGTEPILGMSMADYLLLFEKDEQTLGVAVFGEIGGSQEEEAAEVIATNVTKPVVGLIVGRAAPEGKSLGHAGAIIEGSKGTAKAKIEALSIAGVHIAKTLQEMVQIIKGLRGN